MPLIHGKSQKAFEKNIKTEMHHGKPQAQSLAIAYAVKRKAQHKKAHGGYMEAEKTESHGNLMEHEAKESAAHEKAEHMAKGGFIGSYQSPKQPHYDADFADMSHDKEEMASGYMSHESAAAKHNAAAMHEDERKLGQHGMMEEGPYDGYAKGGAVKKKMAKIIVSGGDPMSAKIQSKLKAGQPLSPEERQVLDARLKTNYEFEPYELEAPKEQMAHGGFIGSHQGPEHAQDMVGRVMAKKMKHYSMGGVVANDTDMDYAKKEPAEYDYLVKEGGDSFHYTGANSGDELQTAGEMSRKEQMLRKIMASRAKKDKMPYYP